MQLHISVAELRGGWSELRSIDTREMRRDWVNTAKRLFSEGGQQFTGEIGVEREEKLEIEFTGGSPGFGGFLLSRHGVWLASHALCGGKNAEHEYRLLCEMEEWRAESSGRRKRSVRWMPSRIRGRPLLVSVLNTDAMPSGDMIAQCGLNAALVATAFFERLDAAENG